MGADGDPSSPPSGGCRPEGCTGRPGSLAMDAVHSWTANRSRVPLGLRSHAALSSRRAGTFARHLIFHKHDCGVLPAVRSIRPAHACIHQRSHYLGAQPGHTAALGTAAEGAYGHLDDVTLDKEGGSPPWSLKEHSRQPGGQVLFLPCKVPSPAGGRRGGTCGRSPCSRSAVLGEGRARALSRGRRRTLPCCVC